MIIFKTSNKTVRHRFCSIWDNCCCFTSLDVCVYVCFVFSNTQTQTEQPKSNKKALLVLDEEGQVYRVLPAILKREVLRVEAIMEVVGELVRSPEKYSGVLVEPYSQRRDKIKDLQFLMSSIRAGTNLPKLPVYVYTTHPEELVEREFDLYKNKHYDVYLCKPSQKTFSFLAKAP